MPNVAYVRKDLVEANKRYNIIRDCDSGELAVKSKGTTYLPMPNASDTSAENSERYIAYKNRAVFYGVTGRTLDGLCGQIFMRDPVIELPPQLAIMNTDADGAGVSLAQLAKRAARYTLGYGRAGLFNDYPAVDGVVTQEQLISGDIRPTLTLYAPWDIINWRTMKRGARRLLSLVVLGETYIVSDDNFELKEQKQWRVLSLENNVYTVTVWRGANGTYSPVSTVVPVDANGSVFSEIPFTFIGAENNDDNIDSPPIYDIASLNIAHYRNSADYEESSFMTGQPTPVFSGLTEDWVKNVLGGKVFLGSRGAISLPVGGAAALLQANPNSMPFEAMQHKEKQMVALGARIVENRGVVRTASEANIDYTTDSSVLASTAKNVAAAITTALSWAARFVGATTDGLKFSLNTDFDIARLSPEARRQLVEEWQTGGISWDELRLNLRKSGIATLTDDEARKAIKRDAAMLQAVKPVVNPPA